METPGRDALQETLAAIDAKDYQRAGETALRGVATPLRLAGESLAELLERFAKQEEGNAWRASVLDALDVAIPNVLDAALVLYANVLFDRLVKPKEEPLFDLDVPTNDEIAVVAKKAIEGKGLATAVERVTNETAGAAAKLIEAIIQVADLWSSCADDSKNLAGFYESAEGAARDMLATAKTMRLAAGIFRSD
jgi:hypothetical protein